MAPTGSLISAFPWATEVPHVAWSQIRGLALVLAVVALGQLVLSVALLGLRPGAGSSWLLAF